MLAAEYALHLFHWMWQGVIVSLVALAIVKTIPRASAKFRSAVLLVAVIKCLLPPMLPVRTGLFSRVPLAGASLIGSGLGTAVSALGMVLAAIHGAGAIARLRAFVRSHRALRHGLPKGHSLGRVRVVVVPSGRSIPPLTFGWLRPVIAIPEEVASLGRSERRIVFAHERSHIERAHGLLVVVEELLVAIVWPQPLLRRVIDERRQVREELCDHDALSRLRITPADYATGLLSVAARCAAFSDPAGTAAATSPASGLRDRFRALAERRRWSLAEVVALLLISVALLPGIQPYGTHHHSPVHLHSHWTK